MPTQPRGRRTWREWQTEEKTSHNDDGKIRRKKKEIRDLTEYYIRMIKTELRDEYNGTIKVYTKQEKDTKQGNMVKINWRFLKIPRQE